MAELPVRQIVMYKHGVGFFLRQGEVSGTSLTLTFRKDAVNDVLKSLAVFDRAGGTVLGVHYQTPMDTADRLASSSIRLGDVNSLRALITQLRGRDVTLTVADGDNTTELRGRMVGLDTGQSAFRGRMDYSGGDTLLSSDSGLGGLLSQPDARVSLLTGSGEVRVLSLGSVRGLTIHDGQSERDLSYFLDTSMAEDDRRTVEVRLSDGDHDIVAYYVAPAPTWRVSYRLVAEADEQGQGGTALLQGWGIFDNRLDEDLDDVRVTLVAGQPISFIYDLYDSHIPDRPTVGDEDRTVEAPVEYAAQPRDAARMRRRAAPAQRIANKLIDRQHDELELSELASANISMSYMAESAPPAAEGREAGETFQYVVTTPVSVKRGESALVPIIGKQVRYDREVLYNGLKLPNHPVAALRFVNDTGLTLERGPVTVVEDGDYKGEAVLPFIKPDVDVYVPYAVELGVKVTEHQRTRTQQAGFSVAEGLAVYEMSTYREHHYAINNATGRDLTITIEAVVNPDWTLVDTRAPDSESATERRWQVTCPPHTETPFVWQERQLNQRHDQLNKLALKDLQDYLARRWLDQATFDSLRAYLDEVAAMQEAEAEAVRLQAKVKLVQERQASIRENLGALSGEGDEATLRTRFLRQFAESQDELESLQAAIRAREAEAESARQRMTAVLEGLRSE